MITVKKLLKRYFIDGFSGMALGLFSTLLIGLIIKQVGLLIGDNAVGNSLFMVGTIASSLMGCGIGVGVARSLKAEKFVLFTAIVAGFLGAQGGQIISNTAVVAGKLVNIGAGEPIGAFVSSVIAVELGLFLTGKTKLDIIIVPSAMIIVSTLVVFTLCPGIISFMNAVSAFIMKATELEPFLMGIIIAVSMGMLLTMPTSSAAIAIALKLSGIAGGAAVVGCAAHMIGFAVMSYRENKVSGLIAQGLGTSMLQIPNIFRKPVLLVPPVVASAVCGVLATTVFKLQCDFLGSGMGTSGLVGVFSTITASANIMSPLNLTLGIVILFFVLPAVICLIMSEIFRKKNIFKFGDLKLDL